jgi:cytidylate kinase
MNGTILCFAGKRGSGKSTISSLVANALGWQRVGFGDYVRDMAKQRGLSSSIEDLQVIGASFIEEGVKKFCRAVLSWGNWKLGQNLVVDGIRHAEILEELRRAAAPGNVFLVFVSVDDMIRQARLLERDGSEDEELKVIETHSTETQAKMILPLMADLIVDGNQPDSEIADEVLSWFQRLAE